MFQDGSNQGSCSWDFIHRPLTPKAETEGSLATAPSSSGHWDHLCGARLRYIRMQRLQGQVGLHSDFRRRPGRLGSVLLRNQYLK